MKILSIICCAAVVLVGCGENQSASDRVNEPSGAGNTEVLQQSKSNAVDSATNAGTAPGGANSRVKADKDAPLAK